MTGVHICCMIGAMISCLGFGMSFNDTTPSNAVLYFLTWLACLFGVFI